MPSYKIYTTKQEYKLCESTLQLYTILKERTENQYPELTEPGKIIEIKQVGNEYQVVIKKENKLLYSIKEGNIKEYH